MYFGQNMLRFNNDDDNEDDDDDDDDDDDNAISCVVWPTNARQ